ncbi:MAG: beta-agarase, partial [Verrucomicrobiota bacterium]
MKITPCVFLLLCFSILMAYSDADESLPLSEEGLRKKAQHDFLFETFSEGRETLFLGEGSDRGLKEITILDQSRQIRHGDEVTLPAGSERVAFFFRHFGFRGADLDRIREVHVIPFSPDKSPPRSAQVEDFYRVQMPTIPNTGEPVAGPMKIRFLMKDETATCRIDDLRFFAQNPISPTFDRIPFVDLGSDQPRLTVAVDVDTEHELVIGGSADLQRERWFRMHIAPGSVDQTFEQWAHQRGFLPARAFLKFKPALTDRNPPAESLQEDPENPGSADLSFFERYNSSYGLSRTIQPFRENTYLMCFNDWPDFMSVPLKGRGTPEVEHFDAAAELAAAFVAA